MNEEAGRRTRWLWPPGRAALFCLTGSLLLAAPVRAQLAITEMMSLSQITIDQTNTAKNSDFWELTNFGSNTISLASYKFSDSSHAPTTLVKNSNPLFIHAGESVVFARTNVYKNEAEIRQWWGSCLASNVQLRFYGNPGFSSCGDGIRVYDPALNLVDSIDFDGAISGRSFVYDPTSGVFGALSTLGQGGACRAATADNVGSPGVTTGPIPLRIVQQPASLVACADREATFTVTACGMPRPRYQWFFNGTAIAYANQASYTVSAANATTVGTYSVRVTNALAALQSSNATLAINTNSSAPVVLAPPASLTVITNRPARFTVSVCAYPAATYQWFSNGVALPGETTRTLVLPNCTFAMSGTEYGVRVANALGSNTVGARLYTTVKPDLRFTEIQAYPNTNCDAHHDWFEVTNFGTNAVDMLGYRFSDSFSLAGARVVTQPLLVQPGESAVFVKTPTNYLFASWWGAEQLPPGLKIFPYCGFSLGKDKDALYLWNATAENFDEYLDSISFVANAQGVSIRFDTNDCLFGCDSVPGEAGAFRALQCGDIGSPGYTTNPPPRFIRLAREADGAHLQWRGVEGKTYQLECNATPQAGGWTVLGAVTAINALPAMTDSGATNAGQRFYRVRQLTP